MSVTSWDGSREEGEDEQSAEPAELDPSAQLAASPLTGKAATQERILFAATDLFLNRGYETTTIQQIADHASVSRATVFWHFSDKESLFRECFSRICEPFRVSLASDFSNLPPEQRLREQVELYQSFVAEHRADVGGFIRWASEHTRFKDFLIRTLFDLHQRFGGALTESVAEIVPEGRDPYPIAMSILLLLDGGLLLSYFDGSGSLTQDVRMNAVESVLEMIPRRDPSSAPAPQSKPIKN